MEHPGKATLCGSGRSIPAPAHEDSGRALALAARFLYRAARWAQRRSAFHNAEGVQKTTDEAKYRGWRYRELSQQLTEHFNVNWINEKDVLDFGCGSGELCAILSTHKPRSLIGIDKSADAISKASHSLAASQETYACRQRFECNEDHQQIPLAGESVDLICCFDVVEHIPDMLAVAREWRRVLRPQGKLWIWWSPWRGPYGHHLESLLPLPWVHLLFPARTLFEACAELYDAPDFIPRKWDRDPQTGLKKPNKWRNATTFYPALNKLTRRQFERTIRSAGLSIVRREIHGFSGSRCRRATRLFLPFPCLGECFVSFFVYELARSQGR